MKLSCTTLGCPDWSLDTVLERLKAYGYDGVDFRGLRQVIPLWQLPEFTTDLAATAAKCARSGVEVSALSSSAKLVCPPQDRQKHLDEITQYVKIAKALGVKMIRVFAGPLEGMPVEQAIKTSAENYRALAKIAGDGICLPIETHDEWADTRNLKALMEQVADLPNAGVLWDLHHPYRLAGESPKTTYDNIGKWVVYTHAKDSKVTGPGNKHEYVLGGQGDVPMGEMVKLLAKGGYRGYVTLEWEKRWIPALPDPEVAFPQYKQYLQGLIDAAK